MSAIVMRDGLGARTRLGSAPQPGRRRAPRGLAARRTAAVSIPPSAGRCPRTSSEEAGLDERDLDPEVPDLALQRLGEPLERELRARVHPVERRRDPAGHGRDVDDRAVAALAHLREHRLDHPQRAEEVRLEQPLPLVDGQPLDRPDHPEARVVDQRVDATGRGHRLARPTRPSRRRARARCATSRSSSDLRPARGRDDLVPALRQLDRRTPTEPARTSRDQHSHDCIAPLTRSLRHYPSFVGRASGSGAPRPLRARARRRRRSSGRRPRRRCPCA